MWVTLVVPILLALSSTSALTFLSIGDWGDDKALIGSRLNEFYDQEAENAAFGLMLGDNFYNFGVSSVFDAQFKDKYLDAFNGKNTQKLKFLVALGNHDYYGNASAQIAYTHVDPTKRWTLPAFYHARQIQQDGVKIFVIVLDTWRLNGGDSIVGHDARTGELWLRSKPALQNAVDMGILSILQAKLLSLKLKYDPLRQSILDTVQMEWLTRALGSKAANESDWKIVVGHYPVHSCSKHEHGDTPSLVKSVEPLLQKYKVQVYLNGHDHILQHIHRKGSSVHYFGSGAGAKHHEEIHNDYDGLKGYAIGTYGFMKHVATKNSLTTTFVTTLKGSLQTDDEHVKKYAYKYVLTKNGKSNDDEVVLAVK